MTKRSIGYWASTGLVALAIGAGRAFDLSGAPAAVETMNQLGIPRTSR